MRCLALSLVLFAACTQVDGPHDNVPPDATIAINCDDSSFQFVAPQPGLHYSTNLVATARMASFYAEHLPGVVAVDALNNGYEPIGMPTTTELPTGMVEMQWSFSLVAGRRYTLYFSATECSRSVDFFTSP